MTKKVDADHDIPKVRPFNFLHLQYLFQNSSSVIGRFAVHVRSQGEVTIGLLPELSRRLR
jgi:hypothetical protein